MGDYYAAMGDKSNAISYFQKALTWKENTETRQKMEKLQKKQKSLKVIINEEWGMNGCGFSK